MKAFVRALRSAGFALPRLRVAQLLILVALTVVVGFGVSSPQAQPQPSVSAEVISDAVWVNNWAPGSSVTVDIGGVVRTVTVDGGGSAFLGHDVHGQDVVPGMAITATAGGTGTTKTLTVVDLQIVSVDTTANTVSGTAPAGAGVHVYVSQNGPPLGETNTTADVSGNWSVDFTGSVDITLGMWVGANVADADGDQTFANRQLQMPWIGAWINADAVGLTGWTPGSAVTLQIGGAATRTVTVDDVGTAWLDRQVHGQDIVPGMTITASDGVTEKTLVVVDLRVTSVDVDTDTVAGIAPAGTGVHVGINQWPAGQLGQIDTTAGPDGHWSVSFAGTVDLRLGVGMGVGVNVGDTDGDHTFADKQLPMPAVYTWIDADQIMLTSWTPGSTITLNIGGAVRTVTVDGTGQAMLQRTMHGQDVVAGMTITASDGVMTKTLVVADLWITSVDMASDSVSGTGPANGAVHVSVNQMYGPPLGQADVIADSEGNWTASFAGSVDITFGVGVGASVGDTDGDNTFVGKFLPMPTVTAGVDWDAVSLNNWTSGTTVTLDIGGVTTSVTTDEWGNAQLGRESHGQDIVPGMTITATDGTTTKTLVVANLQITSVDMDADSISGTAPSGAVVHVGINQQNGPQLGQADTTADVDGNWSVDFAGSVDITFGMGIHANVNDPDGDSTAAGKFLQRPWIAVWLPEDAVTLMSGWTPGSTVTLDIGGVIRTVTVDENGFAVVGRETHGQDLVPGMTITATDGTTTKTLVIAELGVTSVDSAADTVSGTAAPGATVGVAIWQPPTEEPPLGWTSTEADASGLWSVSFSGVVDITPSMAVTATVVDADGDGTNLHRLPAVPTVDAGGPYRVAEGSSIKLTGSGAGEEPLSYEWLGAGDELADPSLAAPKFTGRDDGQLALTLVVTDAAGLSGWDETMVTVTNLPPRVSSLKVETSSGRRIQLDALFSDAGRLDTHTASIEWDDGTESQGIVTEQSGAGAVSADHQYAGNGKYMVTLTVRDDDGGEATFQRQVKVR
jgi:hypothetical protein